MSFFNKNFDIFMVFYANLAKLSYNLQKISIKRKKHERFIHPLESRT